MATQRDIADRLGVSVSLVSRALSGKAEEIGITEDAVRKVRQAAEALGYVPNAAARVLKGASSGTVGVVVFDFEDPFFGSIIGNLQRRAHMEQLTLLLVGFERRHVRIQDLDPLLRHRLDGLIVVGSEPVESWINTFTEREIPVVRIGTGPGEEPFHRVGVDNEAGLRAALRRLRELGHETVGSVAAPVLPHRRRFAEFARLAGEEGLRSEPRWMASGGTSVYDAGEAACRELLERSGDDLPTALFASSDLVAMGAMNVLREKGTCVPDAISIVGFDDIPFARLSNPALTTLRQPLDRMVPEAFALMQGGAGADASSVTRVFEPELILRESTARPPQKETVK